MKKPYINHMKIKLILFSLVAFCLSRAGAQDAAIQSAATINPIENQTRIKYINLTPPNSLKEGTLTADKIQFLTPEEFTPEEGCVTLDFEPPNGFPASDITVSPEGTVWREIWNKFDGPEIAQNRIEALAIKGNNWFRKVDLSWCSLNPETKSLSEIGNAGFGVYLVKDRDAGDIVSSGAQGLMALPASLPGSGEPPHVAGVLFKPDVTFSGFTCVLNSGMADYSVQVVAYGNNDEVLFSYDIGVKQGLPAFVGFKTDSGAIRSIWVGQLYGSDGTIIDDVSFLK